MTARQYLVMHNNGQSEIVPADWASTRQGDRFMVFGLGGFQTGGQAYPFYWLPIDSVVGVREVTGFDSDVVESIKRLLSAPVRIAVQPRVPGPVDWEHDDGSRPPEFGDADLDDLGPKSRHLQEYADNEGPGWPPQSSG